MIIFVPSLVHTGPLVLWVALTVVVGQREKNEYPIVCADTQNGFTFISRPPSPPPIFNN